ncbi:hypothetical protein DAKH74_052600 [Maudiozyma humilis]|uniref:Uncharacterized protein n=1 Tax=Maudiozyma humilis TaxID=51915 RepID=A0AAV5S565_MAUHU|nr:hypothetical protein DAKH74_052600 [Kazachstania humilis]
MYRHDKTRQAYRYGRTKQTDNSTTHHGVPPNRFIGRVYRYVVALVTTTVEDFGVHGRAAEGMFYHANDVEPQTT